MNDKKTLTYFLLGMIFVLITIIFLRDNVFKKEIVIDNQNIMSEQPIPQPGPAPMAKPPEVIYIEEESYEDKLFRLVQEWREESGYKKYIVDESLCRHAERRSFEIVDDWSHDGFDNSSKLIMWNSDWYALGENLAKDWSYEEDVLDAWLESETHRKNLENNYSHSCIKCFNQYCAHWFGKK